MDESDFSHRTLPGIGKRVMRLGIASNYGLGTDDVHHAAERGANFWLWSPRHKRMTPALKQILAVLETGALSAEEDAWVRQYGREVRSRKKYPFS